MVGLGAMIGARLFGSEDIFFSGSRKPGLNSLDSHIMIGISRRSVRELQAVYLFDYFHKSIIPTCIF